MGEGENQGFEPGTVLILHYCEFTLETAQVAEKLHVTTWAFGRCADDVHER